MAYVKLGQQVYFLPDEEAERLKGAEKTETFTTEAPVIGEALVEVYAGDLVDPEEDAEEADA